MSNSEKTVQQKRVNQGAQRDQDDQGGEWIRKTLALIAALLIVTVAIIATIQAGAITVLDKILPLATLAFGFFFREVTR